MGRLISDSVIVAFKLMHSLKKKTNENQGWLGLKLNMSNKARDISSLLHSAKGETCYHVSSVGNMLAYTLAKFANVSIFPSLWLRDYHSCFANFVANDLIH